MTTYLVTFDRVSRDHNVPPLEAAASDADDLAYKIWRYVKPRCVSRDVEVYVDLEGLTGGITAGFNNAGTFTLEARS